MEMEKVILVCLKCMIKKWNWNTWTVASTYICRAKQKNSKEGGRIHGAKDERGQE